MLTVAFVQAGNYLGRGAEYVANLAAGIDRHLTTKHNKVCFTDDPATVPPGVRARMLPKGLSGWWNKLALFRRDGFAPGERVLYLDLDTVVTGSLDDIAAYSGRFAIMRDVFRPDGMQSAIMAWEAGALGHIWETWERAGRPQFNKLGDQSFIEQMQPEADRLQDLFPGQIVSFKKDCRPIAGIPPDARIVAFHGLPRPHEVEDRWIRDHWTAAANR